MATCNGFKRDIPVVVSRVNTGSIEALASANPGLPVGFVTSQRRVVETDGKPKEQAPRLVLNLSAIGQSRI